MRSRSAATPSASANGAGAAGARRAGAFSAAKPLIASGWAADPAGAVGARPGLAEAAHPSPRVHGPDQLWAVNPRVVLARVSGFGQAGPYARRAGFGTLAEAMTGFAALNGEATGRRCCRRSRSPTASPPSRPRSRSSSRSAPASRPAAARSSTPR